MSSDWLMEELLKIAKSGEDEKTKLLAINSALDRVGLGTRSTVEIDTVNTPLAKWEEGMMRAVKIVRTVRVRVDEDGNETVLQSSEREDGTASIGTGKVRVVRHRGHDGDEDEPLAITGEVVHAEVVSDVPLPAPPDNVVSITRTTPLTPSAMLSQTDLQDGLPDRHPRPRGRGQTPSEFNM